MLFKSNLYQRPSLQTLSNAFSKSIKAQKPVWFNSHDLILLKKYHDLPSTTSCEGAAVVFVKNSPESQYFKS